jgi:hypothetical protein
MKFTEFLRRQMSENGEPSNNRVMLFLFLTTVMLLVVAVVVAPLRGIKLELPVIPPSFETFVEIIVGTLVTGSFIGKGITAYKEKGTSSTVTTSTSTEVKGTPDANQPANNP